MKNFEIKKQMPILRICVLVAAVILTVVITAAVVNHNNASKSDALNPGETFTQNIDTENPNSKGLDGDSGYRGSPDDEKSGLEVKMDGKDTLYSIDGGKTWSKEIPGDSGMSVNVEEVK
ncbi:MAG: hypothetical protein LBN22_02825 [Clostridiales Family XIII bacterium]|jgi:hypothetical protein|nr:hypothetical protein [Clostridiales Family XIII bacterium]